ncbi:hypothetical protein [Mucilaginibacter sp. dw_454]|uniref:hypothetical protein n=1 Tax=Mucilaginibacter sp. dw_454 TaxID=2720079 RepID=UPI001BD3E65A|nr:hypothetical protein [Mucilaginibacter sp. dw_454]
MKRSVKKFILQTGLLLAGIVIPFWVLFKLDYLPVITSSSMFDTKMMIAQKKQMGQIDLLAVGSSMTFYQLNSQLMVNTFHRSYYNLASWGLQMGDIKLLLGAFIPQYRPHYVIICSSVGDFSRSPNASYHNFADAPLFMRRHMPELFYFKNFSSIRHIIRTKKDAYPIVFDAWGGAQIKVDPRNDLHIKLPFPTVYTPAAYRSLDSLAGMLALNNIKLIFIETPIRQSEIDAATKQHYQQHFARCSDIVTRHSGTYLNYYNPSVFTDSLFADNYHLNHKGATIFSAMVVRGLKGIVR